MYAALGATECTRRWAHEQSHLARRHHRKQRRDRSQLARTFSEHSWFIAIVAVYMVAAILTYWQVRSEIPDLGLYSNTLVILLPCYLLCFLSLHACWCMLAFRGHPSLLEAWWNHLRLNFLSSRSFFDFALALVALAPFMSAFGCMKQIIPAIHPFSWDASLANVDALLHGGKQPWQWLQPILGHQWVTACINCCYHAWVFVMFAVLFWQVASPNRQLRAQFLLSYVLIWSMIGTVLATILSSAGPCYYSHVVAGPNPFDGLTEYLRTASARISLPALDVQRQLWDAYQSKQLGLVAGISAMPSMHVASSVLFALVGWRTHWLLGTSLTIFALVIQIGSVHLGWHYAIDGYLSAILTVVIWFAVGQALRRFHSVFRGTRPGAIG